MSLRVSMSWLLVSACSGDMYSGVPTTVPKPVNSVASVSRCPVALATPKSSMTLFWGLIALVHWFDPRGEFHYGLAEAITSVPFVVFVALGLLRGRNNGHVDRSG